MNKLIAIIVLILFPTLAFSLSIIPGEDDDLPGMDTPAGSGRHLGTPDSTVCKVVNLLDNNTGIDTDDSDGIVTGDLRYCLETITGWGTGARVVVFEVSGYITLSSELNIFNTDYVTIAGQTAPAPGITLRDYGLKINDGSDHWLVQHIRSRSGDQVLDDKGCPSCLKSEISDPFDVRGPTTGTSNIVVDHNSFSWGSDMTAQLSGADITFQNNIVAEGLYHPDHLKGEHSKGLALFDDSNRIAVINNLISNSMDRNPAVFKGQTMIVNNVIHILNDSWTANYGPHLGDDFNNDQVKLSFVANWTYLTANYPMYLVFCDGNEPLCSDNCGGGSLGSKVFMGNDNWIDSQIETDFWSWLAGGNNRGCVSQSSSTIHSDEIAATKEDAYWPTGYIVERTAEEAYTYVLANVGARPAERDTADGDTVDERHISDVEGNTLREINYIINNPTASCNQGACVRNPENGFPSIDENTRGLTIPGKRIHKFRGMAA
jgi:hypothetical protein